MKTEILNKIKQYLRDHYYEEDGDYFSKEIYCNYNDELSDGTIAEIIKEENPKTAFEELLNEWALDYEDQWGFPELFREIENMLKKDENMFMQYFDNKEEYQDWLNEHVSWYYPESHFNRTVDVNIMLDTGNGNYDFARDNVLNWYGQWSEGEIDSESSIFWLARQQDRGDELECVCKEIQVENADVEKLTDNKFVKSAVEELENLTSHMATLTFLVKMNLFEIFDVMEAMKAEEPLHVRWHPENSKGNGYIIIGRNSMCGLFAPWQGGGSVLDIQLEKDVILPLKFIWDIEVDGVKSKYGYSVSSVYGLDGSAWRECTYKGLQENTEEIEVAA